MESEGSVTTIVRPWTPGDPLPDGLELPAGEELVAVVELAPTGAETES